MLRNLTRKFATATPNKVGFIGMGNMGMKMANNLVKAGFNVKGFDLNDKVREASKEHGISPVDSLAEVSKGVDFIVTSLPKTEHVDSVLNAEDGVFANADPGTLIADSSTISPFASKEFAATAKKHGVAFVDSPMSGGVNGAAAGTLTFMVGTDSKEEFEKASIVLNAMGKNIFHCGGIGTGEIAKLSNNMILGSMMTTVSEGLALGDKLGIDPKMLSDILSVSTASCSSTKHQNPHPRARDDTPAANNYAGGFGVALMRKDMGLAVELAEQVSQNVEFAHKSLGYYAELEEKGHGGKDFGYVFQMINNKQA